jgi:hypothetical protein
LPETYMHVEIFRNIQYEQAGQGLHITCVDARVRNCPLPESPWGALVVKIDEGAPFLVGKATSFVSSYNGIMYLTINDDPDTLDENFGVLALEIDVK